MKHNIGETIKRVEDEGFKVDVRHFRFSNDDFKEITRAVHLIEKAGGRVTKGVEADLIENYTLVKSGPNVAPRGGQTEVIISKGENSWFGLSECSISDNFNRATGVKRALKRALSVARSGQVPV